jgi:site-specific recombinase XerD
VSNVIQLAARREGSPTADFGKVTMPRKPKNTERRAREHLTAAEVEKLLGAARKTRHGHRDEAMVLMAFRHGLRVS